MAVNISGGVSRCLKLLQLRGSVFPNAFMIAVPCGLLSMGMKFMIDEGLLPALQKEESIIKEHQAWSGFTFLVGFLIVFRTSQAYNRFWDGCTSTHQMRAEWFDACCSLVAFCRHSKQGAEKVLTFQHTLVRLFSMLHAAALAELEEINVDDEKMDDIKAFGFPLIDPAGIDPQSIAAVKSSGSKVELIFSWIQFLIVENIETGVLSIPPPILSRAFQEIANGMVAFHDALKITYIPFPFPYKQTCDALLLIHWAIVPLVTTQWVTSPAWAMVFVFIQVFILWSLNFIAVEIENPFGRDANDLDGSHMQSEMNRHLLLLLQSPTVRTPILVAEPVPIDEPQALEISSFRDVWFKVDDTEAIMTAKRGQTFTRAFVAANTQSSEAMSAMSIGQPFERRGSRSGSTLGLHLALPSRMAFKAATISESNSQGHESTEAAHKSKRVHAHYDVPGLVDAPPTRGSLASLSDGVILERKQVLERISGERVRKPVNLDVRQSTSAESYGCLPSQASDASALPSGSRVRPAATEPLASSAAGDAPGLGRREPEIARQSGEGSQQRGGADGVFMRVLPSAETAGGGEEDNQRPPASRASPRTEEASGAPGGQPSMAGAQTGSLEFEDLTDQGSRPGDGAGGGALHIS